ncbi:hypothetical protein [Paenibacillus sp. OV219]|uniref:hypothetical protein n=1 Tax=Paenibacillus sp. OV219 TaxID=1884377 RepID=UPI0008D70B22|nr:hypothetical protein [Paenibacillus sp. OV219]SEO73917.1 hypothetical protein SAMN05518847_11080 [Paenibacillus sp. OV219]
MFKHICLTAAVLVISLLCVSCANEDKQELVLSKQSYVRWHEADQRLEVYAVVVNQSKAPLSFRATDVMLRPELRDATGIERLELTADDRHGTPPFTLNPHDETVFQQFFRTNQPLTQQLLQSGVGIELSTDDKGSLIPIQYGEIQ